MDRLTDDYRQDIDKALLIWKDIIEEYSEVEYAYAKGSAVKKWDSDIDYVPFVSDVDVHLYPRGETAFEDEVSWEIPNVYEKRFSETDHTHLPRVNIKNMKKLMKEFPSIVLSDPTHTKLILGTLPANYQVKHSDEEIRQIDLQNLLEMIEFYPKIPELVVDRMGIEFWIVLRRLTWRVSPTPVRLLSQVVDNPLDLWELNRTKIVDLLVEYGYGDIAESYSDFYHNGWDLFEHNLKSSDIYLSMIKTAYNLFRSCVAEAQSLSVER